MIKSIINWWHSRQRSIDLQILWPACKEKSGDIDQAKAVFAVHAFNDAAWTCLGHDEIIKLIGGLA